MQKSQQQQQKKQTNKQTKQNTHKKSKFMAYLKCYYWTPKSNKCPKTYGLL